MATLARHQFTVVDDKGNVLPLASVEVRHEISGSPLAVIYSDRAGASPIGNPFNAASDGFAAFHVTGGAYQIVASLNGVSRTWRYVAIGRASESDQVLFGVPYLFDTTITDADPGDGDLRFNHATPASVTTIFIDLLNSLAADMTNYIATWDDSGSSTDRGVIIIQSRDGTNYWIGTITGSVTTATGYRKISVTHLGSAGTFVAGEAIGVVVIRRGTDSVTLSGTFETDAMVAAASSTSIKTTVASYSGDLDSLAGTADKFSVRRTATGITNEPSGAAENGSHVVTHVWDTNAARQIFIEFASSRMWTRQKSGAVWGSWVRMLTQDDIASDANVRAAAAQTATDAQLISTSLIESASALVALTDAATIALDWDTGINFIVDLTANRILGNPTNGQPGTWRTVLVRGNDATDRTLTFGNQYFGTVPVITDADNGRYYLVSIYCLTTTHFVPTSVRAL